MMRSLSKLISTLLPLAFLLIPSLSVGKLFLLTENYPPFNMSIEDNGVPVIEAALDRHNAEKLEAGHIDLWASSRFSAPFISETAGVPMAVPVYTLKSVDFYLALNRNIPDQTVSRLQTTLDKMREDGTVKALIDRYL